jgi:hypothetical protein
MFFKEREEPLKKEPLYIGFYKSLYNYVENLLLKSLRKIPFLDIFQISG